MADTPDDPRPIVARRRKISDYKTDPHNANRGTQRGRGELEESLRRFGAARSVVADRNGVFPAGNKTAEVAYDLGLTDVIEVETDGTALVVVRRKDWDLENDSAPREYAYYDNRVGVLDFDPDLGVLLADLQDEALNLGNLWSENEIAELVASAEQQLAGEEAANPAGPSMVDQFVVPPFSVLDSRQAYWQERKRKWLSLGLQSEIGRQDTRPKSKGDVYAGKSQWAGYRGPKRANLPRVAGPVDQGVDGVAIIPDGGISIFDPVLCELAYRWFCPPAGAVLDPFAGGSVRGIVAALLGRQYTGVDLSAAQVAENGRQAEAIVPVQGAETLPEMVPIRISAAQLRQLFNGCDPEYIARVCHASCCESSTAPTGTMITIHPSEQAQIEAHGGVVVDGLLQPRAGERKCPFKTSDHLCGLHATPDKPFGCIASPFTLNKRNTLIVRNRYRLLKCYNDGRRLPAYQAFRASLNLIFGDQEAARICEHLDAGGGDLTVYATREVVQMLKDNDAIKHGGKPAGGIAFPRWITGDSRQLPALVGEDNQYDFIFTCPPYFDLEVYSDDPADLSNAGDYARFVQDYRAIIAAAVARLREDRFACIVVGDIRDKRGLYRNFVSDTIAAFQAAGMALYNEAILITAVGSLPIRAGKVFKASRKLGKAHQNVLIFVKGDPRRAAVATGNGYSSEDMQPLTEQGG